MKSRFLRPALLMGAVLIGSMVFMRWSAAQDELDSLKVCKETQRLLFENSFVRVIDDVIKPGVAEPRHRHPHGLVITLADATVETRSDTNSTWRAGQSHFGGVAWNEPVIHEVRNVGTTPTHYIRVDLK